MVEICDELDETLTSCLHGAPFAAISIVLRYVHDANERVEVGKVNRHGGLEVGIDVPISVIKVADRDTLKRIFKMRVSHALAIVARQFGLDCGQVLAIAETPN